MPTLRLLLFRSKRGEERLRESKRREECAKHECREATNVYDECFQRMPAAFIVLTGVLHISLNLLYVKTQNDQ